MSDRIALVIGNSKYQHVGSLINPQNDATDMTAVLKKLNFDVTTVLDATLSDIQSSVNTFLKNLDEHAVGLLFYAGHGMQIDGKNYFIPVDLQIAFCGLQQTVLRSKTDAMQSERTALVRL